MVGVAWFSDLDLHLQHCCLTYGIETRLWKSWSAVCVTWRQSLLSPYVWQDHIVPVSRMMMQKFFFELIPMLTKCRAVIGSVKDTKYLAPIRRPTYTKWTPSRMQSGRQTYAIGNVLADCKYSAVKILWTGLLRRCFVGFTDVSDVRKLEDTASSLDDLHPTYFLAKCITFIQDQRSPDQLVYWNGNVDGGGKSIDGRQHYTRTGKLKSMIVRLKISKGYIEWKIGSYQFEAEWTVPDTRRCRLAVECESQTLDCRRKFNRSRARVKIVPLHAYVGRGGLDNSVSSCSICDSEAAIGQCSTCPRLYCQRHGGSCSICKATSCYLCLHEHSESRLLGVYCKRTADMRASG